MSIILKQASKFFNVEFAMTGTFPLVKNPYIYLFKHVHQYGNNLSIFYKHHNILITICS